MRPTLILLSVISTVLFSTTSFALQENPFGSVTVIDPLAQEAENPFGVIQATQEAEIEDPFAQPNKKTPSPVEQETEKNPFDILKDDPKEIKPIVQDAETTSPFGQMPVQEKDPFSGNVIKQPEAKIVEETRSSSNQGEFEKKFWMYLKSNAYENWAPAPGTGVDFYVGSSPHGAFLKMYLNRVAVGNPDTLPVGSIIVKENYSVDRATLMAITVMYHSKGYNPDGGDWYWVKFNPDGTVVASSVETGAKPIAGKVSSCIDCHSDAGGNDFTFFNDK